jgi:hypothetical protein
MFECQNGRSPEGALNRYLMRLLASAHLAQRVREESDEAEAFCRARSLRVKIAKHGAREAAVRIRGLRVSMCGCVMTPMDMGPADGEY